MTIYRRTLRRRRVDPAFNRLKLRALVMALIAAAAAQYLAWDIQ